MIEVSNSEPSGSNSIALVEGILAGDGSSVEQLFATYKRGLTFYFARHFGVQDTEDFVTETLTTVWEAVRAGSVREPECLPGFVMTVARRRGFQIVEQRTRSRQAETHIDHEPAILNGLRTSSESPEDSLFKAQQQAVMRKVLRSLSERDREVLNRFYLQEQSPEQIQTEMGMTETQFRLTKSRAKAQFGEHGKKLVTPSVLRRSVPYARSPIRPIACA